MRATLQPPNPPCLLEPASAPLNSVLASRTLSIYPHNRLVIPRTGHDTVHVTRSFASLSSVCLELPSYRPVAWLLPLQSCASSSLFPGPCFVCVVHYTRTLAATASRSLCPIRARPSFAEFQPASQPATSKDNTKRSERAYQVVGRNQAMAHVPLDALSLSLFFESRIPHPPSRPKARFGK
ncbi:hypothetical protein BS50DRAFT_362007 [Corynespora cassiicola Philippines]|uniref:Uncharacterized protein n=1 Tax=Corynespora cassiicola Philippines TaxID=1448308 RepID=A0A2T2NSF8_CORCC|nr:hypothetical protein BS50DRAFT_362007 [Corynespora cassiicola Philippines]